MEKDDKRAHFHVGTLCHPTSRGALLTKALLVKRMNGRRAGVSDTGDLA